MHLLIEAYRGDNEILFGPASEIREYLYTLVDMAGMTPIAPDVIQDTPEGRTGFLILAESHVSIHVIRDPSRAFIDLFTCAALPEGGRDQIVDYTREYFGFRMVCSKILDRGLETLNRED